MRVGPTHLVPCPDHLSSEQVPSVPEASHDRNSVSSSDGALILAVRRERET